MTLLLLIPALVCLAGCGDRYSVRLTDAAGLNEDSVVALAGVDVGSVESVKVVGGLVDVQFEIDHDQDVALRDGACALVLPSRSNGAPSLVLTPGEGPLLQEHATLEQCKPYDQALDALMRSMGGDVAELLKAFQRGMQQATATGGFPFPVSPSSFVPSPVAPSSSQPASTIPKAPAPAASQDAGRP